VDEDHRLAHADIGRKKGAMEPLRRRRNREVGQSDPGRPTLSRGNPARRRHGELSMTDKADHIASAAEAIAVFQAHCRTGDEHAIADLIWSFG
jgi:hypothetical protein